MNLNFKKMPPAVSESPVQPYQKRSLEFPLDTCSELRSYREDKVKIIQKAWYSYMDRLIFRLLTLTLCAAEHYVTFEILKKVSPSEAELIKDPTMKFKVKFRFSGEIFPPYIVFKIFLHSDGHGYKYLCGRNILKSSMETITDTYKIVGGSKFYSQMMEDELVHRKFEISDEVDVVTIKDYMQYSSLLDKIPTSRGGKNNPWRRLELKHIPKTMMIYDIIDFIQYGNLSKRLNKELKFLIQKPQSEEMRQHQLEIITEVRITEPITCVQLPAKQEPKEVKYLVRRPKQLQEEVKKLRKACMTPVKKTVKVQPRKYNLESKLSLKQTIFFDSSFDLVNTNKLSSDSNNDEDIKKDKRELSAWCQKLLGSKTVTTTKR